MFRELRLTAILAILMALLFTCTTVQAMTAVVPPVVQIPPPVAQTPPVWFSDKLGVHQINPDTNQVSLNLLPDLVVALGANSRDVTAWSLSLAALTKYSAAGATQLQINLNTLCAYPPLNGVDTNDSDSSSDSSNSIIRNDSNSHNSNNDNDSSGNDSNNDNDSSDSNGNSSNLCGLRLISVDTYDGSVWLAGNKRLIHLDQNGVVLTSLTTSDAMKDIAVGQDETLWILGRTQLLHYSAQGSLTASTALPVTLNKAKYLAVDDVAGVIWLAGKKQLYQLNLNQPSQTRLTIPLNDVTAGLALNSKDGTVWIAGKNTLVGYAPNGGLLYTTSLLPFTQITAPIALVHDYGSNALWLGHAGGVSRFDTQGKYLVTVPANVQANTIGKGLSIPIPTVSIAAPPANALTNNSQPALKLAYGGLCAGQPCSLPNSYYNGYKPSVLLNSQQVGTSFVFDAATAQSTYTPVIRLPEGLNTLIAQVTDQNGHTSGKVTTNFTIDTIPPKFIAISPSDQTVSAAPQISFCGTIDDPRASMVFSDNGVPYTAISTLITQTLQAGGGNFCVLLTLIVGSNNINLSAIDLAGNVGTLALTYTYRPITVAIASPSQNAVINAKTATVTGSFANATTATVTVNGINATVTGTTYSATVPLVYASNTLAVIATAPNGVTATQSVTVTSTIPNISIISPKQNAVINAKTANVTGSFVGPANSTVTVNGINAAITGTTYSVTVPLIYGSNTLAVIATAPNGATDTQSISVVSTIPNISITSPKQNAVIDAKIATVTGSFAGPANSTVTVNGINAIITGATYNATVPLAYGSNTLTVIATAPNGATDTQSIAVTTTFPTISITSPANGTAIGDNTVLVTGTIQATPNSNIGVVINGVIAMVDANNNFYANGVSLVSGSNTLTATVTNLKGQSSTASVTVNATGFSPFSITANPTQGFGPMTVAFTATSNTGNSIVSSQPNPGAVGALDTTDPSVLFKFTYTQPGIYQPSITVTDSAGTTYTKTIVIQVQDPAQMDQMFTAMWNGMNNALIAKDKATAMTYLNDGAKLNYGPVFDALMPNMSKVVASWSPPLRSNISNDIGEYGVVTINGGKGQLFLIYYLKNTDGVWRLDSM